MSPCRDRIAINVYKFWPTDRVRKIVRDFGGNLCISGNLAKFILLIVQMGDSK